MTTKAELVDAALKVLADYDKADGDLADAKLKMREVYGNEFEAILMPDKLCTSLIKLLDTILDDCASYWLWECGHKGKIIRDGKEWPITSIKDIRAYVMRDE